VLVVCWLPAFSGCVRAGFDRAVDPRQDQSATRELGEDGPVDPRRDSGPGPLGPLTCSKPQLVGGATSLPHLSEAALRTSGLTLVARTMSLEGYETSRHAYDQPFGAWTVSALLPGGEDPTFFDLSGAERAVVAQKATTLGARHLELCPMAGTCTTLSLKLQSTGTPIGEDVDGPSVAALPSGALLMAFDLNFNMGAETEIYLAQGSAADPYTWSVRPAVEVNQIGVKEDDPALSSDGLVLIFNKETQGMNGDLYVSERSRIDAHFSFPRPLIDVNTAGVEGSAYLAPLPPAEGKTRYELFFSSDSNTGGAYLVHRSVCER